MTIEELRSIQIVSITQGKEVVNEILAEQINIHGQMMDEADRARWQMLCDRHFDLRKVRQSILGTVNSIAAIKIKNRKTT